MTPRAIVIAQYVVDEQATSLDLVLGRVNKGVIARLGAVLVLACPVCTKVQFVAQAAQGPCDAPTIPNPIHCGAGYCKRCGVWFRLDAGTATLCDPPAPPPPPAISPALQAAGVTRAPAHPARRIP